MIPESITCFVSFQLHYFHSVSASPFHRQGIWVVFISGFAMFLNGSVSQVGFQRFSSVASQQAAKRFNLQASSSFIEDVYKRKGCG